MTVGRKEPCVFCLVLCPSFSFHDIEQSTEDQVVKK